MRVNIRKIFIVGGVVAFLWVLMTYSSIIEDPKSPLKSNVVEIESRIENLQKQVNHQLTESSKLLKKVKTHLKSESNVHDEEKAVMPAPAPAPLVLPVLVIACDRVTVKRCLDNLTKFRPNKETFPIIVSQDCGHNATYNVIKSFVDADPSISVVLQPDLSEIPMKRTEIKLRGYFKIARHYKFALNYVLKTLGHEAVVVVEDDLDIAPDFFQYFLGTYPLLLKDPSLWCISAWNDNGKKDIIDISRPLLLHRTDFFPGLGWMMRREAWDHLQPIWPPAFFDDWLRNPENVRNKACIRPEISRTYSFGKIGVSKGLFFDKHLKRIHLNTDYVQFTQLNLSYLLKDNYDKDLSKTLLDLPETTASEALQHGSSPVKVSYSDAGSYKRNAKKLGLMEDFRSGVPRTAYRGVVTCFVGGRRVYLAPNYEWTKYDPSWG